MYYTLRRTFYWPTMVADVRKCCESCIDCAKERRNLRKHASTLRPLESVSIDILVPLTRSSRKRRFSLAITCRYSKLERVVPLEKITALKVGKAFCTYWVFPYGPPANLI